MDNLPRVSFNQLLVWQRCKFEWSLQYIHKQAPVRRRYQSKMDTGTMGHELLLDWYTTGKDNSEAYAQKWLQDFDSLDSDQIKAIHLAVAMFKYYIAEFSPIHDRKYRSQSLEEHFEVTLQTPTGRGFLLEGYIDRTSLDQRDNLWVEDYKWTSRFWTPAELQMDPQLTYYAGALRSLGRPVHGCMYTQVNTYDYKDRSKKTVDDLVKRELIYKSPQEIDSVMLEIGRKVDEMLAGSDVYGRSLRRDCGKCDFYEPCSLGLKGIDPVEFMHRSPGYTDRAPRPVLQLEIVEGESSGNPNRLRI